jgi:branched-chain amino acid transport system ATP-binding protein
VAPALARRIAEVIANLKSGGLSIIIAESDLRHSAELLDTVFNIERGAISNGRP